MAVSSPSATGLELPLPEPEILVELGEPSLALPLLVNRGLEANDRAKYLLALVLKPAIPA